MYYELCTGTCSKDEVLYVLNPVIEGFMTVARYAASGVEYDEETDTWTVTNKDKTGDPTCTEGAYNVYTLDGKEYSGYIGATYVNENATDEVADITAVWYVETAYSDVLYGTSDEVIAAIEGLFESGEDSYTITINDGEYTYDGTDFKDADGNAVETLPAGTYTVVLSLAEDYDAWKDGTTEDITYTFTVYDSMASKSKSDFDTTASTLYGDSATVIAAIKALFSSTGEWTVTINGETYTLDSGTLKDAAGEEVSELSAGTYTVVLHLTGDVAFTEDSLLGLGLYYVTGTVTANGSDTTEVVYVYLMDPVYGTVCVYQLKVGDKRQ